MLLYDKGKWNLGFAFSCRGSVFPRALAWALPSALLALGLSWYSNDAEHWHWNKFENVASFYGNFAFIVSFLVVFRTQQAYSRYWEGASLLRQTRGEWFEAASSLVAFSNRSTRFETQVTQFHNLLVRIMSHLLYSSLMSISECDCKDDFEIINMKGVDMGSMDFLNSVSEASQQCEIIMHWLQRLILDMSFDKTLQIEPPIVSRILQELSQGMVKLVQARNLSDVPFPFPYAQILTILLLLQSALVPVLSSLLMDSPAWSAALSFILVFANVACNYIASDLESPFGDDTNDLPLASIQRDFNAGLLLLLSPPAARTPTFDECGSPTGGRASISAGSEITSKASKKSNLFDRASTFASTYSGDKEDCFQGKKPNESGDMAVSHNLPNNSWEASLASSIHTDLDAGMQLEEPSNRREDRSSQLERNPGHCFKLEAKRSNLLDIPWESDERHCASSIAASKRHAVLPTPTRVSPRLCMTTPRAARRMAPNNITLACEFPETPMGTPRTP